MAAAAAFAFLGGLIAGSFVTVVAHRLPRGESIVGPRSRCPACGAQIAAYDNVPVLSWVLLRGRARCCGARDLAALPADRAGARRALRGDGARPLGRAGRGGARPGLRHDADGGHADRPRAADHPQQDAHRRRGRWPWRSPPSPIPPACRSERSPPRRRAACSSWPRSPTPAGWASATSSWRRRWGCSWAATSAPAILVALLAGSAVGLAMIARQGASARKQAIPFGPFLALGGVVGLLAGDQIVDWYLGALSQ